MVEKGKHTGWYIIVKPAEYGGHLILYSDTIDHKISKDSFDHWVEENRLRDYFKEAELTEIKWLDKKEELTTQTMIESSMQTAPQPPSMQTSSMMSREQQALNIFSLAMIR